MEFVYVVPRRELFPDRYPQGFVPFGEALSARSIEDALEQHGFFVERERAERSPQWKQVIPYSVIVVDGEVLLFQRNARGGEARLHHKLSIGIGGHINPEDLAAAPTRRDLPAAGARRELAEEITIDGSTTLRVVGLLNDDSNPVGAVHVGLVQVIEVSGSVAIRETELLEGRCVPPAHLRERLRQGAEFETWSAKLVERLDEILPPFNAAPTKAPRTGDGSLKDRRPPLRAPELARRLDAQPK